MSDTKPSSSRPYVVGVDVGTTVTKAVVFDAEGRALRRAARPTELCRGDDGRYEQDGEQVVASVVDVLEELAPGRVAAVGVTGQGDGLWLLDRYGRPVRPAVSWLDARATGIVDEWTASGLIEWVYRRTGSLSFAGSAAPLLAWLDANEPAALDRAETAGYCKDMVMQRLTGLRATDVSDASVPFLDPRSRRYDDELIAAFGLAHRRHLLAELHAAPTAPLAVDVAGLPRGVPIVAAPYDLPACAWGAGVERVGDGLLIVGTTLACEVLTDEVDTFGEPAGLTLSTWDDRRWLRAMPAMAGAAALDWVLGFVGATVDDLPGLLATGRADGLTVLPFLAEAGERAPFFAPRARASIDGLNMRTTRADVVLAVCEAIAYSARHCLTAANLTGELTACGGGVRSPAWAQIFADVLDRPVRVLGDEEVGAVGAASAALRACGLDPFPGRPAGIGYDPTGSSRRADGYARYLDHLAHARTSWQ